MVCAEFEELLRQACREDSINHALQQKKKRRQRAVANWKLLFRAWRAKRKGERKYVMKKNTISGVSIDEEVIKLIFLKCFFLKTYFKVINTSDSKHRTTLSQLKLGKLIN